MVRKLRLLFLLLILPISAVAQTSASRTDNGGVTLDFSANIDPVLSLSPADSEIKIDGLLDDGAWRTAAHASNFSETFPGDQIKPPVDVNVWMTYDDSNVYLAFKVDDDPARIRYNMSDRDRIWQDDYVGVILDTYGDNGWAYFIASNPLGVQGDTRIINNGGEDMSFDIIFSSEAQITSEGYQVEMAIPLRSLRFPATDIQDWNINFWITHPREDRSTYSWAAIDRDDPCWLCQAGTVEGVKNVSPGRNLELLPSLTGSQSGTLIDFDNPSAGFDNNRVTAEPSLGIKYSFSSNLTADVTVNPDFSQIEADAAQVDVNSTFALFFPERRPFFQEGSNLFNTWVNTVYTRSINNPLSAAKVTGRSGRKNFAYIGGYDRDSPIILPFEESSSFVQGGESVSNIFRFQQTFGTNSHFGALVTDRRLIDGGSGSTASVDGLFRLTQTLQIEAQIVGSQTVESNDSLLVTSDQRFNEDKQTAAFDGESFGGYASYLSLEHNSRHYSADFDFRTLSPTFRAANGFITQNNVQRFSLYQQYTFYSEGLIKRITPSLIAGYDQNFQGERKDRYIWFGLRAQAAAQTRINLNVLLKSDEVFRGVDFQNLRRIGVNVNSNFSEPVTLGGNVSVGRSIARNLTTPKMGRSLNVDFWGTMKPTSRLVLEPEFTFSSLHDLETDEELFSGFILRSRLNYQFNRRLFLRVVTQYNDFSDRVDVDPLLTYKVNPFTAFYIGSTHDILNFDGATGFYQTDRQFFFKFQYLVRA